MYLINEFYENIKTLTEEQNGEKNYYIKGVFFQSEIKNKNNRIYKKYIMEREIKKFQNHIQQNSLNIFGEVNHPNSPNINFERVSHKTIDIFIEGNYAIGKAKIIDTPLGKLMKSFINEGVKLGISSRGLGSVSKINEGKEVILLVNDDYELVTFDIVNSPSCQACFVNGLMENKEWVWENGLWKEKKLEQLKKDINKNSNDFNSPEKRKLLLKAFDEIFKNI